MVYNDEDDDLSLFFKYGSCGGNRNFNEVWEFSYDDGRRMIFHFSNMLYSFREVLGEL